MRALLLVLFFVSARASAQDAPRAAVTPFVTYGFGLAKHQQQGWFAVQASAGARVGVPTAQVRVTALGQLFDNSQRWDVAALVGATASSRLAVAHVAAGPSLAGGIDESSCFLVMYCDEDRGRTLPVRLGVGIAADAGIRLWRGTAIHVEGMANLTGHRTTLGATLGGRLGL